MKATHKFLRRWVLVAGLLWLASGGAWQQQYDVYLAVEDELLKRLEAAGKDAATSIADSIGQAIVKFTSFKDLLSSIEQDLLRIGTKLLITDPLTKSLEGVLKGFSSGDSGFASALRSIVGVGGSPLRIDASVAGIVSQPSVARDALRQIEGGASAVAAGADAAGQAALTAATAAQTGALAALTVMVGGMVRFPSADPAVAHEGGEEEGRAAIRSPPGPRCQRPTPAQSRRPPRRGCRS